MIDWNYIVSQIATVAFDILYFGAIISTIVIIILDNRNPVKTMAWILILLFQSIIEISFFIELRNNKYKVNYRINKKVPVTTHHRSTGTSLFYICYGLETHRPHSATARTMTTTVKTSVTHISASFFISEDIQAIDKMKHTIAIYTIIFRNRTHIGSQ